MCRAAAVHGSYMCVVLICTMCITLTHASSDSDSDTNTNTCIHRIVW